MNNKKYSIGQKIDRIYQVLKERKRLEWFLFLCVVSVFFFVLAAMEKNMTHALLGILTGCFAGLQYKASNRESLLFEVLGENANLRDKLCLSEHKVERLKLELETTQAVLKEAKTPRNTAQQKAEAIAEEVSAEESSDKEVAPKPKRKPAPRGTRKPKTKNENKD